MLSNSIDDLLINPEYDDDDDSQDDINGDDDENDTVNVDDYEMNYYIATKEEEATSMKKKNSI